MDTNWPAVMVKNIYIVSENFADVAIKYRLLIAFYYSVPLGF